MRTAVVHEDVQETVQASSNGGAPHSDNGQDSDVVEQVEQVQGLGQPENEVRDTPDAVEDGPVHRPLIRATLPRVEGHKETRQATDFTIRQSNGRGANFQGNRGGDQRGRPRTGAVMARDRASRPTGPLEAAAGSPGHALAIRGGERPAGLKAEVSAPVRASVVVLAAGGGGGRKRSR